MTSFLTAEWRNLVLLNYKVPEHVLQPFLPPGWMLDHWENHSYVSLVAFQFVNTRVLGIRWPGYTRFPEINLRFYIRQNDTRGVCFIKEYVPSLLVSQIARTLYNEPYRTARMSDSVEVRGREIRARYGLKKGRGALEIQSSGDLSPLMPGEDSVEHFFKEHDLGVGRDRSGNPLQYKVQHPRWQVYPVRSVRSSIDWSELYGESFAFLSHCEPSSVCFAVGSEIQVFRHTVSPVPVSSDHGP